MRRNIERAIYFSTTVTLFRARCLVINLQMALLIGHAFPTREIRIDLVLYNIEMENMISIQQWINNVKTIFV